MLELAQPWWLLLLPLPPAVAWLHRRRQAASGGLLHPLAQLIGELQGAARRPHPLPWLWIAGCLLLVVALARPQTSVSDPAPVLPGHNMIFAVDVSGSMRTLDYVSDGEVVSRLDMAKRTLRRFLDQASALRVGVVIFADDVMTYVPLTTDLALVAQLVDEIDNSLAGERTALGDAIALSIRRMQALPASSGDSARILVVLTDGVQTAGTIAAEHAAELARALDIRLYTLGIGSDDPALFPLSPVEAPMLTEAPVDEATLTSLATRTDGRYYAVRDTDDLIRALADIDRIEKTRLPAPFEIREWFWLPALAGLLLLVAAERRLPLRSLAT